MSRWIKCRKCGHEYSSQLPNCPECSCITVNFKLVSVILTAVIVSGVAIAGFVIGLGDKADNKIAVSSQSNMDSKPSQSTQSEKEQNKTESSSKTESVASKPKETSSGLSSSKVTSAQSEEIQEPASSTQSEREPVKTYEMGTVFLGDIYYCTVPKYYLEYMYDIYSVSEDALSFEEFAYTLTEDDKNSGFMTAKKNEDGSVTRSIGEFKYKQLMQNYIVEFKDVIGELEHNDYIEEIKYNTALDDIDITLAVNELDVGQALQMSVLGVFALEKQYHTVNSSNSCTLNLKFADGTVEIMEYPDVIK